MATTKVDVNCAKDLTGVFQNLKAGSKYLLSFDGKQAQLEEVPVGDVLDFASTGSETVTPVADDDYVIAVGDTISTVNGRITAYTPA